MPRESGLQVKQADEPLTGGENLGFSPGLMGLRPVSLSQLIGDPLDSKGGKRNGGDIGCIILVGVGVRGLRKEMVMQCSEEEWNGM